MNIRVCQLFLFLLLPSLLASAQTGEPIYNGDGTIHGYKSSTGTQGTIGQGDPVAKMQAGIARDQARAAAKAGRDAKNQKRTNESAAELGAAIPKIGKGGNAYDGSNFAPSSQPSLDYEQSPDSEGPQQIAGDNESTAAAKAAKARKEAKSADAIKLTDEALKSGDLLGQKIGTTVDSEGFLTRGSSGSATKKENNFLSSDLAQDGEGNLAKSVVNAPNSATKEQTDEFRRRDNAYRNVPEGAHYSQETKEGLLGVSLRDSSKPVLLPDGTTSTVGEETRKGDSKHLETVKSPNAPK